MVREYTPGLGNVKCPGERSFRTSSWLPGQLGLLGLLPAGALAEVAIALVRRRRVPLAGRGEARDGGPCHRPQCRGDLAEDLALTALDLLPTRARSSP